MEVSIEAAGRSDGELAQTQLIDDRCGRTRRSGSVAGGIDREVVNLRGGLRRGYAARRRNVELVIEPMTRSAADDSPFSLRGRERRSGVHDGLARHGPRSARPAFRRYQTFLRDERLPKARTTLGVSALPEGAAATRAAREMTMLAVPPRTCTRPGFAELERIKAEERTIAETLEGNEDLDALFKQIERPEQLWKPCEVVAHAAVHPPGPGCDAAVLRAFRRPRHRSPVGAVEEPTTRSV